MALSKQKKEWYQKRIDQKTAILENAESALAQALEDGVEAATFDTGTYGARQHYKTLKLDALTKYITAIESQIERYMRLMSGGGLVRMRNGRRG